MLNPLTGRKTIRELIQALELRMILVSSTRLGTMNHTFLSLEAAQGVGIDVVGIVLNGAEDPGLDVELTEFSGVPVIAKIPQLGSVSPEWVQNEATSLFPLEILKLIYGF